MILELLSWWQTIWQEPDWAKAQVFSIAQAPLSAELKDPQADEDEDGFTNKQDDCPFLAGTDEGCPAVSFPRVQAEQNLTLELFRDDEFFLVEKEEIRAGDIFSAGYVDPTTKEIYGESKQIEVTQ